MAESLTNGIVCARCHQPLGADELSTNHVHCPAAARLGRRSIRAAVAAAIAALILPGCSVVIPFERVHSMLPVPAPTQEMPATIEAPTTTMPLHFDPAPPTTVMEPDVATPVSFDRAPFPRTVTLLPDTCQQVTKLDADGEIRTRYETGRQTACAPCTEQPIEAPETSCSHITLPYIADAVVVQP